MNFNTGTLASLNSTSINPNWQFKPNFSNFSINNTKISNDLYKNPPIRYMDPRQSSKQVDYYEPNTKFQNNSVLINSHDSIRLNLNNQDYLYPSSNQEEFICDENYNGNEYYDDDDVISLNVDFTIDEINDEQINNSLIVLDSAQNAASTSKISVGASLPPPPPSTRPITLNKKLNPNSIGSHNIKIELNPEKYSLELSTLSSSTSSLSSTSSKKSLPSLQPPQRILNLSFSSSSISSSDSTSISNLSKCNDTKQALTKASNESILSSFDSSITYYDDFYVSSKLKRGPNHRSKEFSHKLKHSASVCLKKPSENQNQPADASSSFDLLANNKAPKLGSKSFNRHRRKSKKLDRFDNASTVGVVNNEPIASTLPKKKYGGIKTTLKNKPASPSRNLSQMFENNNQLMFNNHLYENVYTLSKESQRLIVKEQQKEQIRKEIDAKNFLAAKQQQFLLKAKPTTNKNVSLAHINLLDDYLLIKIFTKLSTIEKLQLQFVCKRWHQILWSNHNTYKLFNRIEIIESHSSLHSRSILELNQTGHSTSTKASTLSKLFRSKKTAEKSNDLRAGPRAINADLVLKFLLGKMLNRQTYPLCLCVEYITIKNNNRITDRGVSLIAQLCPELKYLCLRNCTNIQTSSISRLVSGCENLKYLDLTGCYNINNIILAGKASTEDKTKALNGFYKKLNFYFTNKSRNDEPSVGGEFCLKNISSYLYLQFIDLSYCASVNDSCIQSICKNCVFIKNLYLRRCKLITDISLLHIAKYCFSLRELSLCQCIKITDAGVKFLGNSKLACALVPAQAASVSNINVGVAPGDYENFNNKSTTRFKIKYLSLAKCPLITDSSLIYLSKVGFFAQIKYLNLRGCSGVTDKFMKYFTGSKMIKSIRFDELKESSSFSEAKNSDKLALPCQLKSLDLAKCSITDKSIEYLCRLATFKPNVLQRLSLRACDSITDNGVLLLALNCRQLQHLNLTKCNKITTQSLKKIKENCQECIVQHTNFSFC